MECAGEQAFSGRQKIIKAGRACRASASPRFFVYWWMLDKPAPKVFFINPSLMLKIGLTGGIGSGKTTVAQIFEVLGIPVYYADDAAKRLMNEDENLKREIIAQFGGSVYVDGHLDRKAMAAIVFANRSKLDLLNALVHPATIRDGERWVSQHHTAYAVREAALIFESGVSNSLDYVIGVSAPAPLRIKRVQTRDGIGEQDVIKRMNNQWDEELKMSRCDFLLFNDDEQLLIPQVVELHKQLVALSQV